MKYDKYGNNVLDGSMQHHEAMTHFDTHDKVVRAASEAPFQAYPKAVGHGEEKTEPVIALNARHEAELKNKEKKA